MHIKKISLNLNEYIFVLIFIVLLINSLLVFTDRNDTFLIYFNKYNKEIFNFSYLIIFFIISVSYFSQFSNYSLINKKLYPLYFLLFFISFFLILDFNFDSLKNSIQLLIIFLLYFFIKNLEILKLRRIIFILNLIIIYSIIIKFYDVDFISNSFFYLINPEYLGIQRLKFLSGYAEAEFVDASQFNYFNIILICFLFINIIIKSYLNSLINLFTITLIFLYLIIDANLYTKTILIFFVIFYLINYKKLIFNKLTNLCFLVFIVISSFALSHENIENFLVKFFVKIDKQETVKKNLIQRNCIAINKKKKLDNLGKNELVCFFNQNFYYHLKSFQKRRSYQNEILNEIYYNNSNLIFGLKKNDLKKLYSKGFFPHNSYLDILINYGLLGLILFLLSLLYLFNKHYNRQSIIFGFSILSLMAFDDYLIGNMFFTSVIIWITIYLGMNIRGDYNEN